MEIHDDSKPSLRHVLAESYVGAAGIAIFFFWFLDSAFRAAWPWISRIAIYSSTAIAEFELPYSVFNAEDRINLISSLAYLYSAIVSLLVAWIVARWLYRAGPFHALQLCAVRLRGRRRA